MIAALCLLFVFLALFWFRFGRVVLAWCAERRRLVAMMEKIPGRPAFPIVGNAYEFKWKIEDFTAQILQGANELQAQGMSVTRLWLGPFPVVCLFNADSVKAVLESQKVIRKGNEYKVIIPWLGTGLLTSTGEKWKTRRKMLTPAFHFNVLNDFLFTHNKEAQIFLEQISKYADSKKVFNIYPYLKRLALDIICETSMGCKVDAQIKHSHRYVSAVQRMNELSFLYTRMPWLWLRPIWHLSGYAAEYSQNLALVTDFTKKVIFERRQEFHNKRLRTLSQLSTNGDNSTEKRRYAFLDLLLSVQCDGGQLNDEDIREEVDTFMFEGHDTTSSGMAWSLWCLAHHQEYQQRVIEEVDEIFGDSQRDCTNNDLKKLKYLEQCVKETLRLYPPVPIFSRMVEEDFECTGYTIPRGATILISPLSLHRDERVFENASQFNPDNFSAEKCASRHAFAYVPFSAGPRNCIGQKFALMEEKTVLSWFFRHYTITASTPFEKNLPCPEITLKPSKGIPVQIFRRRVS